MGVSTIDVEVFHGHPAFRRAKQETIRLVRRVLRGEGFRSAEIGIVFLGDRRIKKLNGQFLQHHYTTDVLSFPLSAPGDRLDGEVYVNIDQARRQAPEFGATTRLEIDRLIVHGVLHLAGYDDGTPKQKLRMSALEDKYLGFTTVPHVRKNR